MIGSLKCKIVYQVKTGSWQRTVIIPMYKGESNLLKCQQDQAMEFLECDMKMIESIYEGLKVE
jgi:hypothetical protein